MSHSQQQPLTFSRNRRALASSLALLLIGASVLFLFEYSFAESPAIMGMPMPASPPDPSMTSSMMSPAAPAVSAPTTRPSTDADQKAYAHKPVAPFEFESDTHEPFTPSASPVQAARELDRIILTSATKAKLTPAPVIDDETFLRRLSIDLLGRIPTEPERRAFLADTSPNRRTKLIESMLSSERFVARLTIFFGDMLRIRTNGDGGKVLRDFVADSVRNHMPYDQMVRQMLTARGTLSDGSLGFLVAEEGGPLALPGVVSQEFMGIRMSCAQCHDHPFDTWTQEEYYGFAAYFGRTSVYHRQKPFKAVYVGYADEPTVTWPAKLAKKEGARHLLPQWPIQMLSEQDSFVKTVDQVKAERAKKPARKTVDELEEIMTQVDQESRDHSGQKMMPALKTEAPVAPTPTPDVDRQKLADLVTSPRNRYFAWNMVNRLWGELLGQGIVDPVDDFRSGNEPSDPVLLNRLADEFVASGYDLRFLIETIVSTQAYQREHLSLDPEARKKSERAYVAAPMRRMNAEAIYDSLVTAGHLEDHKYHSGENMMPVTLTVEERVSRTKSKDANPAAASMMAAATTQPTTTMMSAQASTQPSTSKKIAAAENDPSLKALHQIAAKYSAEEVGDQIDMAIADAPGQVMGMTDPEMYEKEAVESELIAKMAEEDIEYVSRKVTEIQDVNPRFAPSSDLPTPAPSDHMLHTFGQPTRATLDEARDARPNTRQALILLNGELVNQAARVGSMEPMNKLMTPRHKVEEAIDLAYAEILTRKPTATETTRALQIIGAADNRAAGVADLRWVLLNSLEFRYLP